VLNEAGWNKLQYHSPLELVNGLQEWGKRSQLYTIAKGETKKRSLHTCPKLQTGDEPHSS